MKIKLRNACGAILALIILFPACRASREAGPTSGPVKVVVRKVAAADERQAFAYSGTMAESETIPLSFALPGTVARVYVNEGQAVGKGMLLAEIDDATSKNSYEMAKAAEKQAEDAFNRLSRMYKNGNLPEVKYIEVETGLQQARSAAAIAKKNLDDCRLYASAAGFVGKRSIEPGMIALPNLASITIVKIDKVFARVSVPENDIALIRKGEQAVIWIGALGAREFEGKVEDIGVIADPMVHAYKIRIAVANPDRTIKPGMVCTAILKNAEKAAGLVVPNQAVLVDETGRNYVYCLDTAGFKAAVRYVKLGSLLRDGIEIAGGLSEGETIVVSGQHKLFDGAAVQIVER
jgi:RND family efflux transporter MFP subunit